MSPNEMPGWNTMAMHQRNPHFLKKIHKNLDDLKEFLKPEDELLDVGCCEGHLFHHLKHEKYTGIDLFPENIAEARRNHPTGRFEVCNLFDLKGQWDVVFCSRVLIHVPDFELAVKTLRSCTRKHCLVTLAMGIDRCERDVEGCYFRTFSKETVYKTGPLEIRPHPQYATVIYGPLLP